MDDASFVLIELIGDWLGPPRCAACDGTVQRRRVFCAACAVSLETCAAGAETGDTTGVASDAPSAIDVAVGYYGGALARAIQRLKYEDRPDLARPLGELLRGACRAAKLRADAVIPVPLHPRRLVTRGYNQSALLGAHVAVELGAPLLTSTLARAVDTSPQVELSRTERLSNVVRAFTVAGGVSIQGRTIALVDDVSTTGATLAACRRVLLGAGAERVVGAMLARSPSSALGIPLTLDSPGSLDVRDERVGASSGCANVPMRANLRN